MTAPPVPQTAADMKVLAEIDRLERRVADLEQQVIEAREALRTARNFADSKASGYVDDGLEADR